MRPAQPLPCGTPLVPAPAAWRQRGRRWGSSGRARASFPAHHCLGAFPWRALKSRAPLSGLGTSALPFRFDGAPQDQGRSHPGPARPAAALCGARSRAIASHFHSAPQGARSGVHFPLCCLLNTAGAEGEGLERAPGGAGAPPSHPAAAAQRRCQLWLSGTLQPGFLGGSPGAPPPCRHGGTPNKPPS
ncbi:MAG: hypothetical protein J3K34DRAFT_437272 [Monoraphidium minutum]|nr:MAG: hypothetical protein J3K34DRAFT_437272 [Monoraphidium minutum]